MDPEHASIAGRLFFSRAEKNQKAKGRGEKLYGDGGRAAAGTAELAALRHCRSETPQLCSRLRLLFSGRPAIRTEAAS